MLLLANVPRVVDAVAPSEVIVLGVVDAYDNNSLAALDQTTFVEKVKKYLADENLGFEDPGRFAGSPSYTMRFAGKPFVSVDIILSYDKVSKQEAREIMKGHVESLQRLRDFVPEIGVTDVNIMSTNDI